MQSCFISANLTNQIFGCLNQLILLYTSFFIMPKSDNKCLEKNLLGIILLDKISFFASTSYFSVFGFSWSWFVGNAILKCLLLQSQVFVLQKRNRCVSISRHLTQAPFFIDISFIFSWCFFFSFAKNYITLNIAFLPTCLEIDTSIDIF